jgi:Transposase DDE domain
MWPISSSIGTPSKRLVHRASRAAGGVGHGIASKWCLLPRCAPSVRHAANVRSRLPTGRVLHLRPQAAHEALQGRRQEQQTPEFRQEYATRAGIEGTLSQGVRAMGLRRAKYDGLYKTHLQPVLTAVAINLVRIDAVLTNTPPGNTRTPPFAKLGSHPSLQAKACA